MEIFIYLILVALLILLNGFFVLAEFSVVKIRPTQMDVLIAKGDKRAETVKHIHLHLDEYLSVCQVGITLTSVGLGFVGEPAFARIIGSIMKATGGPNISEAVIHSTAVTMGFAIVSYLHIVFGELLPKTISIRSTEKSALMIAYPMIFFRKLFIIPIWILNHSVNLVLAIFGIKHNLLTENHSEDEIRIILEQSQSGGMMTFRGLLLMENVLDLGSLKAKNAIQWKTKVKTLKVNSSKEEIDSIIRTFKFSRYPLVDDGNENPIGYIHIKDLYFAEHLGKDSYDLKYFVKPYIKVQDDDSLEQLLTTMQRKANHMAVVFDKNNKWTGIVTLEDALEEVVGTIEEEYPLEEPVYLFAHLSPERVLLSVEGESVIEVVKNALTIMKKDIISIPYDEIITNIIDRERLGETYVGHGLCIPHARIKGIQKPLVAFVRLKTPIAAPTKKPDDKIMYLFIIITPIDMPRIHQKLLARIAGIFESDFLENRLDDDISAEELYEAICTAEQTSLG